MLGDFGGAFVVVVTGILQRLGHGGMHPDLAGVVLRALRDLLCQRVLERIPSVNRLGAGSNPAPGATKAGVYDKH